MPLYKVTERRCVTNHVLIDAEDEQAAREYNGIVIEEQESEAWSDGSISVEETDDTHL